LKANTFSLVDNFLKNLTSSYKRRILLNLARVRVIVGENQRKLQKCDHKDQEAGGVWNRLII